MSTLVQALEMPARFLSAVALDSIWEGGLILLATLLLLRAWPRLNAATRYGMWLIALVASLAAPVATALSVPTISVQAFTPVRATSDSVARSRIAVSTPRTGLARDARAAASRTIAPAYHMPVSPPARLRLTLPSTALAAVAALWLGVFLLLFVRLVTGLSKLQALKHNALPLPLEYRDALARCAVAARERDVRFCVSDETEVPVAVGLFDSMVLIPRHLLESLSPAELEQVCLHECAHLRRADDWSNLLQRALLALLWFSPAVYALARGLDLEREVACDDDVVTETGAVRPYARCLTKMAEVTAWPHRPLAAPGVFVTRRGISERVERLLRAGRNAARGLALGPAATAVTLLVALGLGMEAVAPILASPVARSVEVAQVSAPAPRATLAPTATPRVVRVPATHVHVPAQHVHVAGYDVNVPPVHVNVPAVHVHVPAINVDVPPVNVDVPPVNVDVPAMHFTIPNIEQNFKSASCNSACDFKDINWSRRNLSGRTYSATDFKNAILVGTNFARDTFDAVDFEGADLRGAIFAGATMSYVDFENARLDGADFTGARISVCDFHGVNMRRVDLSRAHIDSVCALSLSHN
jgi:beta-lactamase regulating signal transducer with metallopeptidase domain